MRVSVFKPQTALEVRRSILGSRCLSELLEPAQLGQLSCQKGHLWDSRRFLDLHGPELLQEAVLLWWLWRDCFHTDPGSKKKGAWETTARVSWTKPFCKTVLVHISFEGIPLVPLSSRAKGPGYVCARQCGCACVEWSDPLNQILRSFVVFEPSQWDIMHIPTLLSQKCPGPENYVKPCKADFIGVIPRSKWSLILRCLISTVPLKGPDCLNGYFQCP